MAEQERITEHHHRLVQYHATTLPTTNLFAGRRFQIGTTSFIYDGTNWVSVGAERTTSLGTGSFVGQRKSHTTRDVEYEWDGSRWVSVTADKVVMAARPAQVVGSNQPYPQGTVVWDCPLVGYADNGIYLESVQGWFLPFSLGQNASNYYDLAFQHYTTGGTITTVINNTTLAYTSAGVRYPLTIPLATAIDNTHDMAVMVASVHLGNPGTFYSAWSLSYRLIG